MLNIGRKANNWTYRSSSRLSGRRRASEIAKRATRAVKRREKRLVKAMIEDELLDIPDSDDDYGVEYEMTADLDPSRARYWDDDYDYGDEYATQGGGRAAEDQFLPGRYFFVVPPKGFEEGDLVPESWGLQRIYDEPVEDDEHGEYGQLWLLCRGAVRYRMVL